MYAVGTGGIGLCSIRRANFCLNSPSSSAPAARACAQAAGRSHLIAVAAFADGHSPDLCHHDKPHTYRTNWKRNGVWVPAAWTCARAHRFPSSEAAFADGQDPDLCHRGKFFLAPRRLEPLRSLPEALHTDKSSHQAVL